MVYDPLRVLRNFLNDQFLYSCISKKYEKLSISTALAKSAGRVPLGRIHYSIALLKMNNKILIKNGLRPVKGP